MANHIILFDASCLPCTAVARRLQELQLSELDVRSLSDPEIVELFTQSGRELPRRPTLLQINDQGLRAWTGIGMRMRLARMLGVRRAAEILGLMAMETRARVSRGSAYTHRLSRRGVLGGAAAGAGAVVLGSAFPASATPPAGRSLSLGADELNKVLASPAIRQAGRVWGAPQQDGIVAAESPRGERLAMVPHTGEIVAFTIISVDRTGDPLGITLTPSSIGKGIRYHLPSGAPLVEQIVVDGEVMTGRLGADAAPIGAEPEPLGAKEFAECMAVCMGASVSPQCAIACFNCLFGPWPVKPYACPVCAGCAGPQGLECARICRNLL